MASLKVHQEGNWDLWWMEWYLSAGSRCIRWQSISNYCSEDTSKNTPSGLTDTIRLALFSLHSPVIKQFIVSEETRGEERRGVLTRRRIKWGDSYYYYSNGVEGVTLTVSRLRQNIITLPTLSDWQHGAGAIIQTALMLMMFTISTGCASIWSP